MLNPKKYGRNFAYSKFDYPKGTCPYAEDLLRRSFLIPFNENYTDNEVNDIANRLNLALSECIWFKVWKL